MTSEMTSQHFSRRWRSQRQCPQCKSAGYEDDARFCKDCGAELPFETQKI